MCLPMAPQSTLAGQQLASDSTPLFKDFGRRCVDLPAECEVDQKLLSAAKGPVDALVGQPFREVHNKCPLPLHAPENAQSAEKPYYVLVMLI